MYKFNKYFKIYFSLVEKRQKSPYVGSPMEIHHIIPKCFGGGDSSENLVNFSAREHYIAHKLLVKITEGTNREKMVHALWGMSNRILNNSFHGYMSSRSYENARKLFLEVAGNSLRGKTYEEIHGKEKAKTLKHQRADSIRKARKGKTWEEIFGKEKADWRREKVSAGAAKRIGKKLSAERKLKISLSSKGKVYPKKECPSCNKLISSNNFKKHLNSHQ
jgi:hypothetical protein